MKKALKKTKISNNKHIDYVCSSSAAEEIDDEEYDENYS